MWSEWGKISVPTCNSNQMLASTGSLKVAEKYSAIKTDKYADLCYQKGYKYIPMCGETTGGWTQEAHEVFSFIYKAVARRSNFPVFLAKRLFYQKISYTLQKQNAGQILNRDFSLKSF